MTHEFGDLPQRPGIHAIRYQRKGLLALGKTNNLGLHQRNFVELCFGLPPGTRFKGGHKAFTWAWLDLDHPNDVKVAILEIKRWGDRGLLSKLKAILLRATEPPYNARVPMKS